MFSIFNISIMLPEKSPDLYFMHTNNIKQIFVFLSFFLFINKNFQRRIGPPSFPFLKFLLTAELDWLKMLALSLLTIVSLILMNSNKLFCTIYSTYLEAQGAPGYRLNNFMPIRVNKLVVEYM